MGKMRVEHPEQLEGTLLDDRYFVQRLLGAGSFGAVYLAQQRVFSVTLRQVALKLFSQQFVTQQNAAEVLNDAAILMQLQQEAGHADVTDHLVTVYDAGFLHDYADQAYMTMEYLDGYRNPSGLTIRTLQGLIAAYQPVPVALAIHWITQIAIPLAWMHTLPRPILHCDLKPDNVLIASEDKLKLIDFGLARLTVGRKGATTGAGALAYQAPETLSGGFPTPATDVYALGLVFYEILAGRNPFCDVGLHAKADGCEEEYVELQSLARQQGLPSLTELDHPDLDEHPLLIDMIERCLRFRASERYDNAALFLRELQRYTDGKTLAVSPPPEMMARLSEPVLTIERLLDEAARMWAQGRSDEALQRCQQAQVQEPQSVKPYCWLAETQLACGAWQDALKACAAGRAIAPQNVELLQLAARCYDESGQTGVADRMRRIATEMSTKPLR